ncbi:zinc finger protein basonuclin-2-like [Limulus polyphemus]|uniref:Zinc finger protein basonuclin-2-like n=1 Tax=Limulus polyphemus TaxID=6850 RepID=A0ABM1RVL1_LIMPO|nr:zinc finger protein basonuclin-2-like [Limulus polyphemus]
MNTENWTTDLVYLTKRANFVSLALGKLGFRHLYNCHQMELIQDCIAFDVASLVLFGTQAIPIRLKILLDRIFSVLQYDEVLRVLQCFGWTYEDYVRGYILQDATGNVLERWTLTTREEEPLILQQFLRFGETKAIAQRLLLLECDKKPDEILKTDSDIRRFIERTNKVARADMVKDEMTNKVARADIVKDEMTNKVARADIVKQEKVLSNLSTVSSSYRPSYYIDPSSGSSTHPLSPSTDSPVNYSSSLSLNNLQPYDFRRQKSSLELHYSSGVLGPSRITPQTSNNAISTAQSNYTNTTAILNSDLSATDCGSDEDNKILISISQKGTYTSNSNYLTKKVKNVCNPVKRRWYPLELNVLNSRQSTGKKRVQCHGCFKTFCDKGALKIHFSAVHLREMHKCTVQGCKMMFSSRRSRNRHSANPNPKLHTPTFRRKMNPHDGRVANPYPALSSSVKLKNNNVSLNFSSSIPDRDSTDLLNSSQLPSNNHITNDISLNSSIINKGVRKRKSFKPTKCAVTSNNEIQYVSTGESSSDTFMNQVEENDDVDLFESKSENVCGDSKDGEFNKDKLSIEVLEEEEPVNIRFKEDKPVISENCENPLHYLENLSMNVYTNKVKTPVRSLISNHLSKSAGISFHARGLGLAAPVSTEDACGTNKDAISSPQGLSSTDQDSNPSIDQSFSLTVDSGIPVDKENPRRCITCGKVFQNHFGVKTHYQNVHLKLMHKCTMEGCNAAFPSKRSRDRHSANINLHRKLLSTSSGVLKITSTYPYQVDALRDDLISRLYDPQAYVDFYQGRIHTCRREDMDANTVFTSHALPFHPALLLSTNTSSFPEVIAGRLDINVRETPLTTLSGRQAKITLPKENQINRSTSVTLDENLLPNSEGQYTCEFCEKRFKEGEHMKSHYETLHAGELLVCSGDGCDRAFLTKRAWNSHTHQDRGPTVAQAAVSSVT